MRHRLLCAAASVIAASACFAQRAPPYYEVIEVPLRPAAIDDAGEVAGTTPEHRAALWSREAGLRLIPLPEGFSHSQALAMNRQGQVVGIAYDAGFNVQRPFLASSGGILLLDGEEARVRAIGSGARAAGESVVPGEPHSQPVVWSGATPRVLENCCGGSAQATNEAGQVAGAVYDAQGRYHAVLWDGGHTRPIGPEGYSSAIAVNNRGEILIQALSRVYLYSASGGLSRLDLAPKPTPHARAINDQGVVVGYVGPFADAARAFLWSRPTGFVDLNSRVQPNPDGWKLETATAINGRGEIVGKGDTAQADNVGFLLIPLP